MIIDVDMSQEELDALRAPKAKRIKKEEIVDICDIKYPWEELECPPEYESLDIFIQYLLDDERKTYTMEEFKELCFWTYMSENTITVSEEISAKLGYEENHISKVLQGGIQSGSRWLEMNYRRSGRNSYIRPVNPVQSAQMKKALSLKGFSLESHKKEISSSKIIHRHRVMSKKDHGLRKMGEKAPPREKGKEVYIKGIEVALCGREPARCETPSGMAYKPIRPSTTVYKYSGTAAMNWDCPEPKKKEEKK